MKMRSYNYNRVIGTTRSEYTVIGNAKADVTTVGHYDPITSKLFGEQKTTKPTFNRGTQEVIKRMKNRTVIFK